MNLHNTLTREKSEFRPMDARNVRLYACGPTVYDFAHIGNARMVVVFDVLFRTLRTAYGDAHVTYVRNITDIDDKIITAAAANGEAIGELTARTEKQFNADMAAIGCMMPTHTPRATEYVPQMLELIGKLIERGHAYEAEGHVLFSVPSMPNYGGLSRRNMEEMIAGARVDVAPYKRDAADFVLWKPSTNEQPGWDSPYGRGRPGWHIECSAMSTKYLGVDFDIHGGGADLMFPHHENEIAQSCCAAPGSHFAKMWVHNGFLTVNGEKMSKSLGNFVTVRDLLDKGVKGEVIRYALLSTHYRSPLDWTEKLLSDAEKTLDKWYRQVAPLGAGQGVDTTGIMEFNAALGDDMNLSRAFSVMHTASPEELRHMGDRLGLLQCTPQEWFAKEAVDAGEAAIIQQQVEARIAAKKVKNWAEADRIRGELKAQGIILEDKPDGSSDWRRG